MMSLLLWVIHVIKCGLGHLSVEGHDLYSQHGFQCLSSSSHIS